MAANELPVRPNLGQLRKRAKDLVKAARAGDVAALHRLSGLKTRVQHSHGLAAVAREHGFPSWVKLKTYVDKLASAPTTAAATLESDQTPRRQFGQRTRGRGPKKTPALQHIQNLHAAVVEAAIQGDPFPFIFGPPLGPFTKAVQAPLVEALVASGNLDVVVDVLIRGAAHKNPRVRFECAHAMDWLADERCLQPLLRLANDPVPRVRWVALHALACDGCKLTPLPSYPDLYPLLVAKAQTDPSARVRREAAYTLRSLASGPALPAIHGAAG